MKFMQKKRSLNSIEANVIGVYNLIEIQKKFNFNIILISTGSVLSRY